MQNVIEQPNSGNNCEPTIAEHMTRKHIEARAIWTRWCEPYKPTKGFKVNTIKLNPGRLGTGAPTCGSVRLNWSFEPHELVGEMLGFCDYWLATDQGQMNWFAQKYRLLSNGEIKEGCKDGPFRTREAALKRCFRWERGDLMGWETMEPGSYSEVPIPPKNCKVVSQSTVTAALEAQQTLYKKLCPRTHNVCQSINSANSARQHTELVNNIPNATLLDAASLKGVIPPGPDVPRALILQVAAAVRSYGRRNQQYLSENIAYYELSVGWLRRGYCFLTTSELYKLITTKAAITVKYYTFAKRLYDLGLFSLRWDK